ncbi:hypothetical protein GPA10_22445 [Streptomyces sp. p1417]|uniref:Uncharacterized protein n=1 Tax=Streptomyces typhae TaxID=2681492 RepID=A0A6L6X154_9ACTN|nr:hypothetical protein [Streptomyces typhae]MVO87446.1 hypothetical protein [Streptomyces typhae]
MHLAYVEWAPDFEGKHTDTFTTDHSHKTCREKHPETEATFECDVDLPPIIKHVLTGETEERARAEANIWALSWVPYGVAFKIHYVGEVR